MDLVLYILFFFPAVLAWIYAGWNYAQFSVRFREVSIFSPAGHPGFPAEGADSGRRASCCLIQGFAEVIRCVMCIRSGAWPARMHDVEETESIIMHEQQHQRERGEPVTPLPKAGA